MDDTEGSVMVDGVSPEVTEESQEHVNNQEESSSEKKTDSEVKPDGEVDGKTEEVAETEDKTEETAEEKAARTEKGTKLDQDPLRQAHQLRANAEAKTRQYEDFLSDPVKVKAYLADLEKDKAGKTETKTEDLIDPEKLETVGDLQKFAKQLQTKFQTETEKIRAELGGITQKEQIKEVANRVTSEVTAVQTKYPELREFNEDGTKNPDYNEELDKAIGEYFNELDLDQKTGMYRGKHSIVKIAERFMKVRTIGEKNGSIKAQTIVKDKRTGRVITNQSGGTDGQPDESTQSAGQTIAARMKRAAMRR